MPKPEFLLSGNSCNHILKLTEKDLVVMQAPEITFFRYLGSDVHKMIITELCVHENIFLDIEFFFVVDYFTVSINDQG